MKMAKAPLCILALAFLGVQGGGPAALASEYALPTHSNILSAPKAHSAQNIKLAQLKIQLGGSKQKIRRALREQGYTEIEVTYSGLTKSRAEACKDGDRVRMEVTPGGRVKNSSKIGDCRTEVGQQEAGAQLVRRGYLVLRLRERRGGGFLAEVCQGRDRYDVRLNRFGDEVDRDRVGRCRVRLNPAQIAAKLRAEGYNRLKFTDDQLPRYRVEACDKLRRVELTLNRRGEIRDQVRVGECTPPINPRQIGRLLRDKGYNRVNVIDAQLPRYMAEACRDTNRVRVVLTRFGDVRNEKRIGRCSLPTLKEINDRFRNQFGFKEARTFIEACRGRALIRFELDQYGEIIGRERTGRCR